MNSKKKVFILSILIVLIVIVTGVSITYALWQSKHVGSGNNIVNSGCLNINYLNISDDISVNRTYPGYSGTQYDINDYEVNTSVGDKGNDKYWFMITNTCTTVASYDVNLETLEGSDLDSKYLDIELNEYNFGVWGEATGEEIYNFVLYNLLKYEDEYLISSEDKILSNYSLVNPTLDNAISSNRLSSGILNGNESRVFSVSASLINEADSDSYNKTWNSKITVNSSSAASTNLIRVTLDYDLVGIDNDYINVEPGSNYWNLPMRKGDYVVDYWYLDDEENKVDHYTAVSVNYNHTLKARLLNANEVSILEKDVFFRLYYYGSDREKKGLEINSIRPYEGIPDENVLMNAHVISENGLPTYAWKDGSVLYYYSSANTICMQNDDFNASSTTYDNVEYIDLSRMDTHKITDMSGMFAGLSKLKYINLSSFDTSNVTDMSTMFNRCTSLVSLDLSNFDTSKVTKMNGMFYKCTSLENVNVSSFSDEQLTNVRAMFSMCRSLSYIDLTGFSGKKLEDSDMLCDAENATVVGYVPSLDAYYCSPN